MAIDQTNLEQAVKVLLTSIGENPSRDGLVDTPARVARAWAELTSGYDADISGILSTTFDVSCDEMVVCRGIRFHSLCEHHLLPFYGEATVAYIPDVRVVGLSKMARLVDAFARRLQVQERLTTQIAEAMHTYLQPRGVGVIVKAHHLCMGCRGVRQPGAEMVTSATLGAMRQSPAARAEFLALGRSDG